MAATIIAAIGLAAALGSTAYGIAQQKKAEKIRANNPRPTYTIAPELYQNQQIAEFRAGTGLPDYVQQYYRQGAERGLATSVDKILKGGGSSSEVAPAYSVYNDAMGRLALADDERQYKNMQNLLEQNRILGASRDTDWQVNQYGPYADKAQLAAELSRSGGQYIQSGINTAASSLGTYAGTMGQKKDTDSILGRGVGGYGGSSGGSGGMLGGAVSKSGTGVDYDPSLMNSGTGRNYLRYNDDLTSTLRTMKPEQQRTINGLYGNRLDLDTSPVTDLNYFNANSYRY